MIRKILPLSFAIVLFLPLSVWSQATLTSSVDGQAAIATQKAMPSPAVDDWSIYTDQENKTIYIDFEHISVNLSDIVVKDEQGQVVMKDEVFELPVNTIYEVDYQNYTPGRYEIELRSFTGILRKTFQVN